MLMAGGRSLRGGRNKVSPPPPSLAFALAPIGPLTPVTPEASIGSDRYSGRGLRPANPHLGEVDGFQDIAVSLDVA